MAHINLLPWREEKRQERQQQFYVVMGLTLAFAILVFYVFTSYMNGLLDKQNQRNNYLQQEITKLDIQIKEIQDLEKKRDRLLARMRVIQDLQQSRPKVVKVFDSVVRTVPEGIHLQVLSREGDKLIVQGVAQTNARVSVFMNQLDKDPEFSESKLRVVQRTSTRDDAIRQFTLEVTESKPETNEEQ
ncbi:MULTISPECIES: PilN domain-containing protein [unclassified Methylophaga]|uniref:PilN domain-containing protein n=1 Tax=unclassified Methylophaga TaxID=2629249 RepID=UPI000C94D10D|nr:MULTISPECIES: PilN domain-containing protein [unclassified Methylophaga]MBN47069.1 pilus assembly protein PilN [Methylophaga sp.]|tara:strand:+ start:109429 stop:109989 length:561 start_codon:yes stop_codon:yes gene_type:complete